MISTNIWVGLKFEQPLDRTDYFHLENKMPAELWDALHQPEPFTGTCTVAGIAFRFFNAQDNIIGFGAPIFGHAWESGPEELDLASLNLVTGGLQRRISSIFQEWNFQAQPRVYLMEDHP